MVKILFVCHGNICRSPMAEFIFNNMAKIAKADCISGSKATSSEELGRDMHYGAKAKLREMGIPFTSRRASRIERADYDRYDLIIGMDRYNMKNLRNLFGGDPECKLSMLLDHTDFPHDVDDPWYTGNFDQTYDDIYEGCRALLESLTESSKPPVSKLTNPFQEHVDIAKSLFGILPNDASLEEAKEERLGKI